jgi:hypothetical protein
MLLSAAGCATPVAMLKNDRPQKSPLRRRHGGSVGDGLMGHEIEKAAMPSAFAIMRHEGFIGLLDCRRTAAKPSPLREGNGQSRAGCGGDAYPPAGEREQRNRSKGLRAFPRGKDVQHAQQQCATDSGLAR